ncbi:MULTISPECIES: hypothetical protein [Pseudomonas syringae group genomosp. 2]|uniref:Uncharacterized protein n=1 Tax=Pseudomonas ficuserectae TaxID=53410 RepID=A0ABV4Q0F2_9PSED|nr:hypothetical protein [Pseudomonas amygdali]BCS43226.1 hypothetical protein Pta6605_15570 [Pseudomonas amygdali pv. tabaci]
MDSKLVNPVTLPIIATGCYPQYEYKSMIEIRVGGKNRLAIDASNDVLSGFFVRVGYRHRQFAVVA